MPTSIFALPFCKIVPVQEGMDAVPYVDELVREYLVFRGLVNTQRTLDVERSSNPHLRTFQADKLVDTIMLYAQTQELAKLEELWGFLDARFFSRLDSSFAETVRKLKLSVRRYYVVQACLTNKKDKVHEFFEVYSEEMLRSDEWKPWFALPFTKSPESEPAFELYFQRQWAETLQLSLYNFINTVFMTVGLPKLLNFNLERLERKAIEEELEQLREENVTLREQVQRAEDEKEAIMRKAAALSPGTAPDSAKSSPDGLRRMIRTSSTASDIGRSRTTSMASPRSGRTPMSPKVTSGHPAPATAPIVHNPFDARIVDTFTGHSAAITCARFSTNGDQVASGSLDSTVRIFSLPDRGGSPSQHNATVFCTSEVTTLEWEHKTGKLLLFGTADRNIKLWNVDSKRVINDMFTDAEYPRIMDIVCSPTDSVFVSAAASRSGNAGLLGLWNLRSCKLEDTLPLEPEPVQVNRLCFNHNGNMLATGAADGMIRVYDRITCSPIMAWPAHDGQVLDIRFSHDETTIISCGTDGKITEWSLYTIRKVLRSIEIDPDMTELAPDGRGRHYGVCGTSNGDSGMAIYHVNHDSPVQHLSGHASSVITADWHSGVNRMVTGGEDSKVVVHHLDVRTAMGEDIAASPNISTKGQSPRREEQ